MGCVISIRFLLFSYVFLFQVSEATVARRAVSVPQKLPGDWVYKGCYTEVGRTINSASYIDNAAMTDESCIAFCSAKRYSYAGTEYFQECYCGTDLAAGATLADEADCNAPCTGNASEPCGGGNRLSLFYSPSSRGPQPNNGITGWPYIGCYTEGATGRALTYGVGTISNSNMTGALCTSACKAAGYILAGVEYGGECYCGNTISNGGQPASDGCSMPCNGNSSEICGGPNRLSVYDYNMLYPVDTSSSTTSTSSTQSSTTSTSTTSSTKTTTTSTTSTSRTTASTTTSSTKTTTTKSSTTTTSSTKTTTSKSSTTTTSTKITSSTTTSIKSTTTKTSSTSSTTSSIKSTTTSTSKSTTSSKSSTSSSSVVPAPTGMPAGWTYQGCWTEGTGGRAFAYQFPDSNANTQESCAKACVAANYTVSGTEFGTQCFCGVDMAYGATKVNDGDCNTPCPGSPDKMCGGGNRLTVWSPSAPKVWPVPTTQKTGLSGSWTYHGCVEDNVNQVKTFAWQVMMYADALTPDLCVARCAKYGYMAAGLEYGRECYCGDPQNIVTANATLRPESECTVVCSGLPSAYCGGGSRLTTYFWTGDPLYSWTFPQDPSQAGKYEYLTPGVTVPLMVTQSITGKVTFLSKGPGTARGNETGAYELDLTLTNNFTLAWRPLHVQTDVFCSAGITLPDKVGRQISLGGWADSSTVANRIYWPDGTPGVWGTHDWQENQTEVALQANRWYATAMLMSNGSILVVGGEQCSNCAATPSLEILPYTGSPPLFMEWLNRTHPNNLYPFMFVLPSGGIFAGYWNEAIILDPVTFATIKTLPPMPGTVTDDKSGGRTYPQEGAAVLLPQKAPYTDPLGILICGGSTEGPANPLDTCISTYPDVANPTWAIERMPSVRVMPCIAPLPDGTYLVANGAFDGRAGFGLSLNANKNALLYDPSKPVGSRFTVMANTTIGRLYHSEAITLLDGRVLISGSDPFGNIDPTRPASAPPEEYRVEVFIPPYLLSGKPRPSFTINNKFWAYGQTGIQFQLGSAAQNGKISVTLLGAVTSTHGNSMGARTLMPAFSCAGTVCTVDAPPNAKVSPPGWYQMFVLDGGVPAVGMYVSIGGDPAKLGNWPPYNDFLKPGL